jgi:hypothetical protein
MEKIPNRPMPCRQPVGIIAAIITTIIIALTFAASQIAFTWTPLQRYYLPDLGVYALAKVLHSPSTNHRFVGVVLFNGRTDFARDSDFVPGQMQGVDGSSLPFALSDEAIEARRTKVFRGKKAAYATENLGLWFQVVVFPDLTPIQFAKMPCVGGLVTLVLGLWLALPFDRERARIRRFGRRLRGPEYVNAREFVRRLRADGIGFLTQEHGIWRWMTGRKYRPVRISKAAEAAGICILGATGSGKSALCLQLVDQAIARGDRVVIVDAALEFTERFFGPGLHTLLNPWDERTDSWDLKAEIGNGAEARALACSMLPHRKGEHPFFVEAAQRVLAELLKHKPSTKELSVWLSTTSA